LLPHEEVSVGSGTTYKTVAPSVPAVAVVETKKKVKHNKKRPAKKPEPGYQKPYSELSASELASLKAASR
jgi:hypothetical protein